MRKIFLIALKDLRLAFSDPASLTFMLLAPFVLTIGLGLATGSFSKKSNFSVKDIPVAIVNQDGGSLGNALVETFFSSDLADLLEPQKLTNFNQARQLVDEDKISAAIYIPAGFTDSIIPKDLHSTNLDTVQIEFYGNPTAPTSVGIIRSILDEFLNQVEISRVGGVVTISQLLQNGLIDPSQALAVGNSLVPSTDSSSVTSSSITLREETTSGNKVEFNMLALLAPGMALMFLMYTVSYGGRTLLVEQNAGTLPRLLVSPTSSTQVLGGKVLGIFLTGISQLFILIVGTGLLFKLQWGNPLAVVILVLAAALAATGWGILLAAIFKTPGQIAAIGSALMLIFGMLGGSFSDIGVMPQWVQWISRLSPNRWGLDGFTTLAMGGTLKNIFPPISALLIMAAVLFLISALLFRRRGIGRQ